MQVELLHASPLWLAANAIRMSRDNQNLSDTTHKRCCPSCHNTDVKFHEERPCGRYTCENCYSSWDFYHTELTIGDKDRKLIYKVGNKLKHKSVLEQLVYWFEIDGISRACLQELARHRTARLTVKSTRYTLKELKNEEAFYTKTEISDECFEDAVDIRWDFERVSKYCVLTGNDYVDMRIAMELEELRQALIKTSASNDIVKYMLPEAYKVKLQWQIDGRNLQNFLALRTSKEALWEIRNLAYAIYNALPNDHKYLYEEFVQKDFSYENNPNS